MDRGATEDIRTAVCRAVEGVVVLRDRAAVSKEQAQEMARRTGGAMLPADEGGERFVVRGPELLSRTGSHGSMLFGPTGPVALLGDSDWKLFELVAHFGPARVTRAMMQAEWFILFTREQLRRRLG